MTTKIDPIQATIDVGSAHIRVILAVREQGKAMEIVACDIKQGDWLKNGIITDIVHTATAIRQAIDEVERQSGVEIRNVDVSFGGEQVSGINADGEIIVQRRYISEEDIARVIEQARSSVFDPQYRMIHVLAQQYLVDEHGDIREPVGMMADKLSMYLHVLRAEQCAIENLHRAIEMAGVGVNAIVFSGLASGYAATTPEERKLGVCALDIGAGTTNFMVWQEGMPVFSGGLKIGGEEVSSALAVEFVTPRHFADLVKCEQGALSVREMKSPYVELLSTGLRHSKKVDSAEFSDVIAQSYDAIFCALESALHRQGMRNMAKGGLVLSGGAAQIPGLVRYIEENFAIPARLAQVDAVSGLPVHLQQDLGMMTSLGMLKLIYEPIADHVWVKLGKQGIIRRTMKFLRMLF